MLTNLTGLDSALAAHSVGDELHRRRWCDPVARRGPAIELIRRPNRPRGPSRGGN
jgi:hypothetical protein